jgi:diguanylate cyclase (GGDEF)-like protein
MVVAGVRILAVVQAVVLPFIAPLDLRAAAALVAYCVVTALLTVPLRETPVDSSAGLPSIRFWIVVVLDVAASAAVGWYSGFSLLIVVAALDAAALPLGAAVIVLLVAAVAYGLADGLAHVDSDLAQIAGLNLLTACAAYAGAGFGLHATRKAERQMRAINRVLEAGSDMGRKLALPEVLSQLVNMLKQFEESVPWQTVVVYIASYDAAAKEDLLRAEALAGSNGDFYRGATLHFGEGVVGHAAMEQLPIIVADLQKEPREQLVPKPKAAHGFMAVPIVSEGQTIGCVSFIALRPNEYTFEQQRLVDRLIRLASVGIQNARLHEKTVELAETDSMTGLLTNRAYQERLEAEFRKAQAARQSLSLLILDVDYFKRINDTYGHPQGDELLRQLGDVLRQHARKADICCRYGGDEFTIVMPETIKAEAAMVAGRIRQAIEETTFTLDGNPANVTISIGVAGYPQDVGQKVALVAAADKALYAAKHNGRNTVQMASHSQVLAREPELRKPF